MAVKLSYTMGVVQRYPAVVLLPLLIFAYMFMFFSPVLISVALGFIAVIAYAPKQQHGDARNVVENRAAKDDSDRFTPGNISGAEAGVNEGMQRVVEQSKDGGTLNATVECQVTAEVNGNLKTETDIEPKDSLVSKGDFHLSSNGTLVISIADGLVLDARTDRVGSYEDTLLKIGSEAGKETVVSVPQPSSLPPAPVADDKTKAPDLFKLKDSVSASPGARAMAAALRARTVKAASGGLSDLLVLYGSQTGNAMEIAKGIAAEAPGQGIKSRVFAMNDFPLAKLARSPAVQLVVIVVSSTGDGDPPENCDRFFHSIKKASEPNFLKNIWYTVCGLGDSNYTKFMGVPKIFNTRFSELGAHCFYKSCEADEVAGLEDIVDQWTAGLWVPLKAAIQSAAVHQVDASQGTGTVSTVTKVEEVKLVGVPPLQPCRARIIWEEDEVPGPGITEKGVIGHAVGKEYSSASPFFATVGCARYMTPKWSDRKVIHVTFNIQGSGITYRPGDSIGVMPENNEELVDKLLNRLGADGSKSFRLEGVDAGSGAVCTHIKFPCTIKAALLRYCTLTGVPTKGFLRMLAEYTTRAEEKERLLQLCSRGGKELYAKEILTSRPHVLDLLEEFPSCSPPLAHLFDSLPPLVPRYYSVSSSPLENPETIDIAFSVVQFETKKDRTFKGVCTNWLLKVLDMEAGERPTNLPIPIFPKGGGAFHLPSDLRAAIIMIGPGTGVAPFRGFLQERCQIKKKDLPDAATGESWLFFGCRREDEDYLYRSDFEAFVKDGSLTHFEVAFSRESEKKVYVQDKIKDHGQALCSLLINNHTHVYICGDGANMAKDVHLSLLHILEEHGGLKESMAIAHFNEMTKQGRYVRDIWS